MNILYFCPRWGSDTIPWDDFLTCVKNAGYDGVEIGIPQDEIACSELLSKIASYDLQFIAQHWETNEVNFDLHKTQFRHQLKRLAATKPILINSHTGKDYFTIEQNLKLIQIAQEVSQESNIVITHETHRGRFSFAAHITNTYIKSVPKLPITLDISHWFCVAESLLFDQQETIENCFPNTYHIHARIGHTQGPQLDHFGLTKWRETYERHFDIWEQIVNYHRAYGSERLLFTTEFGPPPYMHIVPLKKNAIEFQFEQNLYILNQLKERFNKKHKTSKILNIKL